MNWQENLRLAKKEDEKWAKRAKKMVRRYRDERSGSGDNGKRYNIFWANVQTIFPALYAKTPQADVKRRWGDKDPVARTAALVLERSLQFEIEHYTSFDSATKSALLDRLIVGRGVAWVRLETEDVETEQGPVTQTKTCEDYVFWEDFRCSPARSWEEVTWIAKRVYMSKGEVIARFGEEFADVPLTHEPIGIDEMKESGANVDDMKKAQIWEIWDKSKKMVTWVADGYQKTLDEKPDPYRLDGFFPIPRPLFATQTTDTLVPVPDFALYQDQAEELDKLTNRISMLVEAVKVVGVYDASQPSISRMLSEGVNNTLIPVDTWAAFAEKGGIKGTVDFLPLDSILVALNECYKARESAKQVIYEVTGLSDIIRGASMASETATAQQIKSQYASLRLKRLQAEVARFVSELLQIKGQLMADFYPPEQLVEMSGIQGTDDFQYVMPAIQLLKSEPMRTYRIQVASDSLVEMDEQTEKQNRMEFLTAVGGFMDKALPVAQQVPELAPLMGEMLQFGIRAFKSGQTMEAAFEAAISKLNEPKQPAPPQPDPEQIKMQGQMQLEQAKQQSSFQLEQFKAQNIQAIEAAKMQHALEIEQIRQQAETGRAQLRAQIDAETKLQIAQMNAQASEKPMVTLDIDGKEHLSEIGEEVKSMASQAVANADSQAQAISQAMEMLAMAVQKMNKPKRKMLERGPDGRAIGVIEISEDD